MGGNEGRQVSNFTMINKETGEEILHFDHADCKLEDEKYEIGKEYKIQYYREPITFEMEIDFSKQENNKLYEILGIDVAKMPDKYDINYMIPYQLRTHKKKRINKKWAKKYGYGWKQSSATGWKLETCAEDRTFTFVK